ncbi:MAG TPA: hypothetical protein PK228_09550, partial [Saprospiraceae bacterium]|nr:hypothetical protein [Saprospiraceae bacterium]
MIYEENFPPHPPFLSLPRYAVGSGSGSGSDRRESRTIGRDGRNAAVQITESTYNQINITMNNIL